MKPSSRHQPTLTMAPPPPPPPPLLPAALPQELIEEILLRFPPGEPASLFLAALVCKPWCRLISGPRFRRRFRELHRTPPMLGFLCNASFVPTTAFCPSLAGRFHWGALDARHGRVLIRRYVPEEEDVLVVWDPITDEQRVLPIPPRPTIGSTAAVLCASAGAGAGVCHHLDCHRGPFLVVFFGFDPYETFIYTYLSDVDAWSEPISTQHLDNSLVDLEERSVLVGNALYFGIRYANITLKYNLESREMSWIQLPYECSNWRCHVLTTTEEGVLGLVTVVDSKLSMWLRKDAPEVDAGWTKSRVIDLKTLLPLDGVFTSPHVFGFADGPGIVFMIVGSVLYTIDLKTYKVELYQDTGIGYVVLYMSFYTPGVAVN